MKTKQEILKKYIQKVGNTEIVDPDNALLAMQEYANQFNPKYKPEPDTKKILINTDIGLFNLSYLASQYYLELSGQNHFFYRCTGDYYEIIDITDIDENDNGNYEFIYISLIYQGHIVAIDAFDFDSVFFPGSLDTCRDDENLIKAFEVLGDKCNTEDCKLLIIEIPNNIQYYIEQQDGCGEVVHEYHKQWWS